MRQDIKENIENQQTPEANKRPISVIFMSLYGAAFIIGILLSTISVIDFIDFLYGLLIMIFFFAMPLIIIFLVLFILNLRRHRNKHRAIGFIIGTGVCIILVPMAFLLSSLFKDQLIRADEYLAKNNFDAAIRYYDYAIEHEGDSDKIELAVAGKEKAQELIDEAKSLQKNGDVYFNYGLYGHAEEEYRKAYKIYPYLDEIKDSIKKAVSMSEKNSGEDNEIDYILLDESLKFKIARGLPSDWGHVKISDPLIAEFQDIAIQKGRFFESDNELRVNGIITGKPEIEKYLESDNGLFVFISAAIVDDIGNIKWSRDGYIKDDTPYLKAGEMKEFSLTGTIINPIKQGDRLIIAAYLKNSVLVLINPSGIDSPDADKNIFAIYSKNI
jgi:tetratricopeptide (TPR) repeat protein